MGLAISKIECSNFRSYHHLLLNDVGSLTLIVGPNATGKTNLLEGIQLTTACTSFRHPRADHLLRKGKDVGFVRTNIEGDGRQLEIELRLSQGNKEFYLNKKKKRTHTLRGILPSVLFCPDDLNLIKGSQSVKRSQLDLLGSQVSSGYNVVRKDYEKILRQKNSCLKQNMPHDYLVSINEVLASVGAQLYHLRSQLIAALIPYIQKYYQELSLGREQVSVSYIPSWQRHDYLTEEYREYEWFNRKQAQELLFQNMEQDYIREHERHMSLYGPQVDQIEFYLNDRNASLYASQGQQRSLVLSYKMAEVALIRDKLNQNPVLLLDDVMSELDNSRRSALFSLLSKGIQTFITATNAELVGDTALNQARIVELDFNGVVSYG